MDMSGLMDEFCRTKTPILEHYAGGDLAFGISVGFRFLNWRVLVLLLIA